MIGDSSPFQPDSTSPSYVLKFGKEHREVFAHKSSPAFRLQLIKEKLTLRFMYSFTDYQHSPAIYEEHFTGKGEALSDGLLGNDESDYNWIEHGSIAKGLSLESQFVRLGFDYKIDQETTAGVDEIFMTGRYDEQLKEKSHRLKFQHLYTSAYIKKNFGHYVSLKFVGNFYSYKYDYSIDEKSEKVNDTLLTLGGAFELLF